MQIIRAATDQDFDELVTLATASALDNPLYKATFGAAFVNSIRFFTFVGHVQSALVRDALNRRYCMVIEQDNTIVAAAILDPGVPEHTLIRHLLTAGWFRLFPEIIHSSLLNLVKQANLATKKLQYLTDAHTWVLRRLMISPMYRDDKLGTQLMEQGIVPELKRLHVNTLLLTANTHARCQFYTQNQFSILQQSKLRFGAKFVDNWILRRQIFANC